MTDAGNTLGNLETKAAWHGAGGMSRLTKFIMTFALKSLHTCSLFQRHHSTKSMNLFDFMVSSLV